MLIKNSVPKEFFDEIELQMVYLAQDSALRPPTRDAALQVSAGCLSSKTSQNLLCRIEKGISRSRQGLWLQPRPWRHGVSKKGNISTSLRRGEAQVVLWKYVF
jgi:hypothetical protein